MNNSRRLLILCFAFTLLISGCSAGKAAHAPQSAPWAIADLRALDPLDAQDPDGDLLAGYARVWEEQIQVRLDLLDSSIVPQHDLYLAIDNQPGGKQELPGGVATDIAWDRLVYLPAQGQISIFSGENTASDPQNIMAIRKPDLDTIDISLPTHDLRSSPGRLSFQAFTLEPASGSLVDSTTPFSLDGQPPAPARTLLAFWNTLPAYSPAQALRRWDGAHTGPLGARHGLGNLLKAARDYQAPVALLDLKNIASLAALDYLDQVDTVKSMADRGLLILPDNFPVLQSGPANNIPDDILNSAVAVSRQVASELSLPATQLAYGALSRNAGEHYRFLFLPDDAPGGHGPLGISSQIYRYAGLAVLPLSTSITTTQATLLGPSLEIRGELVKSALQASEGEMDAVSILGGDLSHSTWGDPQHAAATLRWLNAHPWIRLLDTNDLLATRPGRSLPDQIAERGSQRLPALLEKGITWAILDPEPLATNAWQAFLASYAPVSPGSPLLTALRRAYLGQVNILLAAARWADKPGAIATCDTDPDLDGQPECILANESQFAAFEIDSGALVDAFVLRDGSTHQWIASSSQFITGLSDPALWQPDKGLASDPEVIPGAFSDEGPFQTEIHPQAVTFTSPELTKTFALLENGMDVRYETQKPVLVHLPLAVDPWLRFKADGEESYAGSLDKSAFTWGMQPGSFQVQVRSDASINAQDFTASREAGQAPENPNVDYPAGHFVLFPLAVVDISAPAGFVVNIRFIP